MKKISKVSSHELEEALACLYKLQSNIRDFSHVENSLKTVNKAVNSEIDKIIIELNRRENLEDNY